MGRFVLLNNCQFLTLLLTIITLEIIDEGQLIGVFYGSRERNVLRQRFWVQILGNNNCV